MMKKLLLTAAFAVLAAGAVMAAEPETKSFTSVADTWVRSNNNNKYGTGTTMQLNRPDETTNFVALVGFDYELPAGMKVKSATLRLLTRCRNGKTKTEVYAYGHDFDDASANKDSEWSYVEEALNATPIVTFNMKGMNKSVTSDAITSADYQTIDAWTNTIDLTSYVATAKTGRINFVLSQPEVSGSKNEFFTREQDAFTNDNTPTLTATKEQVVPTLIVEFVEDADRSNVAILPVADTQIRKNNTANNGAKGDMEIKTTADGQEFYGILEFALPADVLDQTKYTLNSAVMRLVTTQNKGSRGMNVYAYGNSLPENENTTFAAEETFVNDAKNNVIATFDAKGAGNLSMGDNKSIPEDYHTAAAWTNNIDLTDHVKSILAARNVTDGHVVVMIGKAGEHSDAMKFATKEATDIVNPYAGNNNLSFAAADLKPQLILDYSKKTQTGIEDITVDENAPVEYYNINGMRVNGDNLTPGLYIRRQGGKATKVYVK